MDLQKEREAFEESFKIKWEIGHYILKMVKFIEDSQDYAPVNAVKQMSDEYYWVLALNTGWYAWQAAKAQAVPEGFVLVPKEPSADLVNHGHQVFLGHFNECGQTGGRSLYFAYKAMIEAQEQNQ